MFNLAARITNLQAAAHLSILHTCTFSYTHTLKHAPHKPKNMYILTHKHILCLDNRLHMVGSGHGPRDCLMTMQDKRTPQPGHSLRLTGPNTPGSLSKETGSLFTVMSWMHPTKEDVTGSVCCIKISAEQQDMVVNWWVTDGHFNAFLKIIHT